MGLSAIFEEKKCTFNGPKLHMASPHAITGLLPCNCFPNYTQTHVVTYINHSHKIPLISIPAAICLEGYRMGVV